MIFGFNTDVPGKDGLYHVQTEDRGSKNPVIETMIYIGGKILGRRRTPYLPSKSSKEEIADAVRKQHRELVESIRAGTWVPEDVVTRESSAAHAYFVELLNPKTLLDGESLCFKLAVRDLVANGHAMVSLDVRWLLGGAVAEKQSLSSADGNTEVRFPVPADHRYAALLVCAKGPKGTDFAKFHVRNSESS